MTLADIRIKGVGLTIEVFKRNIALVVCQLQINVSMVRFGTRWAIILKVGRSL